MAVQFEHPQRVRGEPVVVVAIKHDMSVVVDAGAAEQLLDASPGQDVAARLVLELGRPVPADGALDVALAVGVGVDIDLDEHDVVIASVFGGPVERDKLVCHLYPPCKRPRRTTPT